MSNKSIVFSLALVVVLAGLGYTVMMKTDAGTVPVSTPSGSFPESPEVSVEETTKRIGIVTTYTDPAGEAEVGFTVVVDANGTIVDASAEVLGTNDITKVRQTAFAADFAEAVKGKKIAELTAIDRVGGSSLTTKAFNDSLDELRAQL